MTDTRRALLDALTDGPVAGPDLADRLGVSRTAVWKQVEALREGGLPVESTPEGYVVAADPGYGAAGIEYGLAAPFAVEFHDAHPSTNDRARALAGEGETDVVVVADEQTAGRGRLDREWEGPSGGIYASILCRPDRPPAEAPLFTLAAAVAVARAAREAGVDAGIKWPNDVLVPDSERCVDDRGGAKLAGILTEMQGEADRVRWLVVGTGVNANVDAEALPAGATSLRAERGSDVDRRVFLQRTLEEFHVLRETPEEIIPAWRKHGLTLGRRVRVGTPDGDVVGEAIDVAFPGALVVDTGEEQRTIHAGDCEHLRPE